MIRRQCIQHTDGSILMLFPTCVENACLAQPCKSGLLVLTWKSKSFASELTSRSIPLHPSSESLISLQPWYSSKRSRRNPDIMQTSWTPDPVADLLFPQQSSFPSLTAMPIHRHCYSSITILLQKLTRSVKKTYYIFHLLFFLPLFHLYLFSGYDLSFFAVSSSSIHTCFVS